MTADASAMTADAGRAFSLTHWFEIESRKSLPARFVVGHCYTPRATGSKAPSCKHARGLTSPLTGYRRSDPDTVDKNKHATNERILPAP